MRAGMGFKVICMQEWDLQLYASRKGICGDMQAGMGFKVICNMNGICSYMQAGKEFVVICMREWNLR